MKIVVVGATGTIGRHVVEALKNDNQIISVGHQDGDYQIDMTNTKSIQNFFETIGSFDALIVTAGIAYFGPFDEMTEADFRLGIDSKLMGQINLVLIGKNYINPKGSFTLTSGTLSEDPVRFATAISTVNGAINSFVKASSVELENGVRINAVSPGVAEDSPSFHPFFPGKEPVSMKRLSMAYIKSTLGARTGQIFIAE